MRNISQSTYFVISAIAVIFLIVFPTSYASAEEPNLCFTPVFTDPDQMSEMEARQPNRLVTVHDIGVFHDFPGLLIKPTNRGGIYTVADGEYKRVPPEVEARIGRWGVGKKATKPKFTTIGMSPGFTRDDMYPKFYPELGLYLMRSNKSIWFRKTETEEWKKFAGVKWFGGFNAKDMGGSWEKPEVWKNESTGRVVFALSKKLIFVGEQLEHGADLSFKYHIFRAGHFKKPILHKKSGQILIWTEDRTLRNLRIDRAEGVKTPWKTQPTLKSKEWEYATFLSFRHTDPETGDVLFRYDRGLARFDGLDVRDIPHWSTDRLSKYTDIIWLDGERYAKNYDGIFHIDADIYLTQITTPYQAIEAAKLAKSHRIYEYHLSSEFERIFLSSAGGGRVFTTKDFISFKEVRNDTGIKIGAFVSDIPGENSVLFTGTGGLYAAVRCKD